MILDITKLSTNQTYHYLTQTIIPRPIAWILTKNENNSYNLAPFSFFNAICSNPALLMVSIGHKDQTTIKDTAKNIKTHPYATVHIADTSALSTMNKTSASLDYGDSEIDYADIALEQAAGFPLPVVANAPLAFSCELYDFQQIGNNKQNLVFLEAKQLFIADHCAKTDEKDRLTVDATAVNPLCRLGASQYASLGNIMLQKRE